MYSPNRSNASAPAANLCHSNSTPVASPAASTIRTTAADTSGPIPSPGISVIACFIVAIVSSLQNFVCHSAAQRRNLLFAVSTNNPQLSLPSLLRISSTQQLFQFQFELANVFAIP